MMINKFVKVQIAESGRGTCVEVVGAYRQASINNYNKRAGAWTREETNSARSGYNFNLNKWSRGRHLCPRLVLFMPDYSECTCAAVSSAGRVRCLMSCQCFPEPHQVCVPACFVLFLSVFSPPLPRTGNSVVLFSCHLSSFSAPFALIYAIATRDASSAH